MEEEKVWKQGERTFFSPSVFYSHFLKTLKFVLGLPKWKFSTGKKAFHAGKMTLPPLKNIPLTPLHTKSGIFNRQPVG